jgi:small subunit ribosomal protein S1
MLENNNNEEKTEDQLENADDQTTTPQDQVEIDSESQTTEEHTDQAEEDLELPEDKEGVVILQEDVEEEEEEQEVQEEDEDEEVVLLDDEEEQEAEVAHDDYEWEQGSSENRYSDEEFEKMEKEYANSLQLIEESEIISGKVKFITGRNVVLDLNYKSDGLVSLSEFRDLDELKPGDEVDVYVERREDERGQLVLSRRKAKLLKAWDSIVDSYENGTILKGHIISKTKGGMIVNCNGLETFLPGSQIDIKPIIDYDSYVGKTMEFKVVKINEQIKNAVVSHKALIESDLAEQREAIIAGLEKGQVLEGIVKNITDFGAFLDLGGVDGLLYITDISWGRISHPSEVLSEGEKINVAVLDFDEGKKRISLGLKQLQPHPWDTLSEDIQEGSLVKGKIVNIEDYGAFLEISPGVEGLIHVSEVTWSNQPVNAKEFFNIGDEYEAKVVTIDKEDRKMSLSIKQLSKDPWDDIDTKYPLESHHRGIVKNLTPYGVFVELEEGIGGMIHISDLSWTKRYSHPSEFTKVGDEIDIVILEIDLENRKLNLGHKQLEEDPWNTFENVFPVGSYHQATVLRKDDRGAIMQLPYGLEAFTPIRHLKKEDGTMANVEDELTVKVIEFNRDDKRILVSHLRYLQDIQKEADDKVRQEKTKQRKETRSSIQKQQSKIERTTLGDMAVFDELKEKLEEDKDKNEQ